MVLFLSTAIVQLGMEAVAGGIGISIKDEWLFEISGGLGTAITGILCASYVKKKNYTDCIGVKEPVRIKKCLYYSTIMISVEVLFYAITTVIFVYVFFMTDEVLLCDSAGGGGGSGQWKSGE